jgi:hypothetical protein
MSTDRKEEEATDGHRWERKAFLSVLICVICGFFEFPNPELE